MVTIPTLALVNRWTYHRLKAMNSVLTLVGKHPRRDAVQIYFDHAPEGWKGTHCIFKMISGPARNGQAKTIFKKYTYLIKIVFQGDSTTPVHQAVADIETGFQMDQTNVDEVCAGCRIIQDVFYPSEEDDGALYNHMGFLVEIMAYPATQTT